MKLQKLISRIARLAIAIAASLGVQASVQAADAGLFSLDHPNVKAVMAVQKGVTADLMGLPGVLGTAVGLADSGETALVVYVDQDSPSRADIVRGLPPQIRGTAVKVELTDKFVALKGKPPGAGGGGGGGVSHTAIQTPPIQLGTSGGWGYDLANGYCCGGTLGSLIQVNEAQYILSNYHVLEADIVEGGNQTIVDGKLVSSPETAEPVDPIIQPGLIDVGCNVAGAQNVATLVKLSALTATSTDNVDCAVAQVIPGQVRTDGAILEIGTISSSTIGEALNQSVKKSGRTTGLTTSKVSGLNATVRIAYDNECAGGAAFTKTFTGQIVISNKGSKFLAGGDSGSLMVENVTTPNIPRAIGLLYAGSSFTAIANPIDHVLAFLGSKLDGTAKMVGN